MHVFEWFSINANEYELNISKEYDDGEADDADDDDDYFDDGSFFINGGCLYYIYTFLLLACPTRPRPPMRCATNALKRCCCCCCCCSCSCRRR